MTQDRSSAGDGPLGGAVEAVGACVAARSETPSARGRREAASGSSAAMKYGASIHSSRGPGKLASVLRPGRGGAIVVLSGALH